MPSCRGNNGYSVGDAAAAAGADYWERAEFPFPLVPKMKGLGIGGGTIKGHGCAVSGNGGRWEQWGWVWRSGGGSKEVSL